MRFPFQLTSISMLCVAVSAGAAGEGVQHDPQDVLAYRGDTVLTQDAMAGALDQVPAESRSTFVRDREKISFMINALLLNKKLAGEAYEDGLDKDPLIQERLKLAVEKELAMAWEERMMDEAPEADFEAIAHERYIAEPEQFRTPEKVDVSHILIKAEGRSEEQAEELAAELAEQLKAEPERFEEFVERYSGDPGRHANKGRFPAVTRGQMVRPFEKAAFAMSEPGEISAPVKSRFGWHIIRFNGRTESEPIPYEEVRERLVRAAMKEHRARYRDTTIAKLVEDPVEFPDGALEAMLKRQFGENLERAPVLPGQDH